MSLFVLYNRRYVVIQLVCVPIHVSYLHLHILHHAEARGYCTDLSCTYCHIHDNTWSRIALRDHGRSAILSFLLLFPCLMNHALVKNNFANRNGLVCMPFRLHVKKPCRDIRPTPVRFFLVILIMHTLWDIRRENHRCELIFVLWIYFNRYQHLCVAHI